MPASLQRHSFLLCPSQVHPTPPSRQTPGPTIAAWVPGLSGAHPGQELRPHKLTQQTQHPGAWVVKGAK